MSKLIFRMSVLLTIMMSVNAAMGVGPGPDEWQDEFGRPAPAVVRHGADNLWDAVQREGVAAFEAGWGMGKKLGCGAKRCILCCFTCGISECAMKCSGKYNEFGWGTHQRTNPLPYVVKGEIYDQRTKELTEALTQFKDVINRSVMKPEHYSGDANICELGPWVEDGAWHIENIFVSGRRDLSAVPQSVRNFVNAHGGWAVVEKDKTSIKKPIAKLSVSSSDSSDDIESCEALVRAGIQALEEKKYTDSYNHFRKASEQGDPKAQCYLGTLYRDKNGIPEQDFSHADELAVYWTRKADAQNFGRGTFLLARMYEEGRGIPKKEKSNAKNIAKDLYQRAFSLFKKFPPTDSRSQYNLGQMYQLKLGISPDEVADADSMAIYWYKQAGENGDKEALYNLGWMYENGTGVAKDEKKAARLFRAAANRGNAKAQLKLALCFQNGKGVEKNINKAIKWAKKAMDQNYAGAQNLLTLLEADLRSGKIE